MTDALMKLYSRLPASGRSAAASLRGVYLRSWRYGRQTEALIEQALEREKWTPQQWKSVPGRAPGVRAAPRGNAGAVLSPPMGDPPAARVSGVVGSARELADSVEGNSALQPARVRRGRLQPAPDVSRADQRHDRETARPVASSRDRRNPLRHQRTARTALAWCFRQRPLGHARWTARRADCEPPSAVLGLEQSAESVVHVNVPSRAGFHPALSRRARSIPYPVPVGLSLLNARAGARGAAARSSPSADDCRHRECGAADGPPTPDDLRGVRMPGTAKRTGWPRWPPRGASASTAACTRGPRSGSRKC